MLAPIIVFAFNRPEQLKLSIESLSLNSEIKDSILYIFIDAMRNMDDKKNVDEIEKISAAITGFKKIIIYKQQKNLGLANSIIQGVSRIIKLHGRAIILEDDLIYSPNFLAFLNQGLDLYKNNKKVFSICAYSNTIKTPTHYKFDAYFCTRSSSWGWATWQDRWESVDWNPEIINNKKEFNLWGGSDCYSMLKACKKGKNNSWAIRFCYAQFLQNKISLFPLKSKVKNLGFDGSGTHCKTYNRFDCTHDNSQNKVFKFPENTEINKTILHSAKSYHSLKKRIWSKLMYILKIR
ncbi:MAG: glycosyltransferase [Rikenellaceae bacterium]